MRACTALCLCVCVRIYSHGNTLSLFLVAPRDSFGGVSRTMPPTPAQGRETV